MTRVEAKKLGLKHYNTGKPCKRGHNSDRYTVNGGCIGCHSIRDQKWRIEHLDIMREAMVKWRKTNKELETARRKNRSPAQLKAELKAKRTWRNKNRGLINSYAVKHRAQKLKATPAWADIKAVEQVYITCPKGYHVDHIVPLQGKIVCGLHTVENLQVIPASLNTSKGNRYWPDMPT